ncbi:polyketide synthase [Chaetomium strumarium]|uniref:Polyketide synthase n=1 Tax=Chaetomium strumarium TaxID=1170767 RepID=A0AAJ0H007_9PEZI|nr:polyketide synthase [Chaetomium strumarium]
MPSKIETAPQEPIAIVGSACRFAGDASSPSKLWDLLREPRDVRSEIPDSRFSANGFYHPDAAHHGRSNVKHSYLLNEDPAAFDAEFFGINPIEARAMDPQQRILLETVYEAVESAGMTLDGLKGSDTAVYAGVMIGDYEAMLLRDLDAAPTYFAVGTSRAILSNRVSYFFDWHGAAVTIDTACSSSLVAVHSAIQTLRAGDSRMAVACGANVILGPETYIIESKLKMLSPDGRGRMWDKDANGYARGDGVAAILLKTLSAAIADGDHIECIIRETGLNQDGTTTGLTMPSAAAQRALIRSTYARAGLDVHAPADRPQFFEAHGTGTPAGDPVEAEAISTAFFGGEKGASNSDPLFVGSIKTVLGHTEGTAGIAALLKAKLALQNACLPPNLLFDKLSPSVEPFYQNLQILRAAKPWPTVPTRRASVNSFGFGGTNAHAILESYEDRDRGRADARALFTPFVFSAASEHSLRATLSAYAAHLGDHPETDVHDLAYTLRERRTVFSHRAAFPATSIEALRANILARLESQDSNVGTRTLLKRGGEGSPSPPKMLGVFTGQGAQYPRMAAELIRESPLAARIIRDLEVCLGELPVPDRPSWSLEAEILAAPSVSRMGESAISQPLNTAVQIMLVDLLRTAGIHFDAVVGHSGGEVGAAYAAGFLTARDALCVAYYRGLNCKHARSPNGSHIAGAMLAVGTSAADAAEICNDPDFSGRISVAAVNSSTSVTISGDEDAIAELEVIVEEEKKFHRRLRVDNAYHSHHMVSAADPYLQGMRRAGIKARQPTPTSHPPCTWFSSVFDGRPMEYSPELSDEYWVQNMVKPVLFSRALEAALSSASSSGASFDAALEVGPHAALKSPAGQTIQEVLQKPLPYQGALSRGSHAIEAFSTALGFLWSHLDKGSVALGTCEAALSGGSGAEPRFRFRVLKDLPPYQWNHGTKFWHESRRSRHMRLRQPAFHPLLGDPTPDSSAQALRWKNMLKPSEMQWLEGHTVQGQTVFPAAGYVATALEAARVLAAGSARKSIRLIELSNMTIHQAVAFSGNNDAGIEVLVELTHISHDPNQPDCLIAQFTYSAALGGETASSDLTLAVDAELRLFLGEDASPNLLPERQPKPPHMIPVEEARLYGFMESLEYNFSGPFRSLVTLERKLGRAACVAKRASTPDCAGLLIHPVDLDAAFQSIMVSYSYPGDEQLRNLHLPTTISKIRVNPSALAQPEEVVSEEADLKFMEVDSTCNPEDRSSPGSGFSGNVNIYVHGSRHAAVQVDHVLFKPMGAAASDDHNIFCKMDLVPAKPDGYAAAEGIPVTQYERDVMWILSRIVNFYLRRFDRDVPEDSPARSEAPLCHYLHYARYITGLLDRGENKFAKDEWRNDTLQDILDEIEAKGVGNNSDVRIMLLVGEVMPRVFNGETTMLEHFRESGLLDEYYARGFGTMQSAQWLGSVVKQIADRHPHLNLLEIGAGTGGATKYILNAIGKTFDSYTFTDISSSFFENAAEALSPWADRIVFKTCDAERDPVEQGFAQGTYDVVVAYMVLHATARLDESVRNLRKLLRPGGFLLIGEGSSDGMMQVGAGFIFGTLPGWWRGVDEGRTLSPLVNAAQWDDILKRNGFSGIDTMSPPKLLDTFGITLFVTQAVDARIELARDPLSVPIGNSVKDVVLVGGQTPAVEKLARGVENILTGLGCQVHAYSTLEQMDVDRVVSPEGSKIISLADLDHPVFQDITPERWYSFRRLFEGQKSVLWLTKGRLRDEPYHNMTVGFGRSAVHEDDDLHLQYLDIPDISQIDAKTVVEAFVRFNSKQLQSRDILYTVEPEIILDEQGRELVPRLTTIPAANNRLNSTRRLIDHEVDVRKSVVELVQDGGAGTCCVRQLSRYDERVGRSRPDSIELRTTHAILSAIKTPIGHRFLAIGAAPEGVRYLTLVSSLASVLHLPVQHAVPLGASSSLSESTILRLAAAQLIAAAIVGPLFAGQRIVTHNAPDELARAIESQAAQKQIQVTFVADTTSSSTSDEAPRTNLPGSWIQLPQYAGKAEVSQLLPADIAVFVGFSGHESANEQTLLSALPSYSRRETAGTIYLPHAVEFGTSTDELLGHTLTAAAQYVQENLSQQATESATAVPLETIAGKARPQDPLAVVDWTSATVVPARVTRFDIIPLFKNDKTYWLCGLSGALGISLCDWMIDRGVRYLVLTSRNPKINQEWIDNHAAKGVTIRTLSCDVTDEAALRAVHKTIVDTFPPIVGVLNGAMVLRDGMVRNMVYEQVTDVIRPKVLGSMHLDRIFHDVDLDFFVLLSSINCVIGNVGQANYAAANMGMCGVAAARRRRGLVSSVANVGAIIGVGYITQSARQLDLTVANTHLTHLSEEDFHQIFAEAMEAGYPDSPDGPEISTGLLEIAPDTPNMPKWYSDPKFARLIVSKTADGGKGGKENKASAASILDSLKACRSEEDVFRVVKSAFAAQLRRILQISTGDDDMMNMRSIDLGLDSLISVDIRSWFLKNLQVSIPVLKIMANDAQMSELVEAAVEGIPAELIPEVRADAKGDDSGSETNSNTNAAATPSSGTSLNGQVPEPDTAATSPGSATPPAKGVIPGIDWEAEARPPPDSLSRPAVDGPNFKAPNPTPRVVVLTGCTGLLGHHLLETLAAEPSIEKVICIAVRQLADRLAKGELPAPPSDRIVYYEGDLSAPRLGLSEEQETAIFNEADAVIHNGSDTSHLKYYSAVRDSNVGSTKHLVRLCVRRMIPLHYISSAGVALFAGLDAFPEISVMTTNKKPPADGAHGYMCGKWVCERMLEQVHAATGLPIWIQRPSTIIREGADATNDRAGLDWVNALLHYAHAIAAVPRVHYNKGSFDLVYVRSVCADVVAGLLHSSSTGITYVNNVGDVVIPMHRMATEIARYRGREEQPYEVIPMDEWMRRAIAAGLHPAVAALIETFDEPGAPSYPRLLKKKA